VTDSEPIDPAYVLSEREFDILCGDLRMGQVPYPLQVPSVGRTMSERDRIREDVHRALARRGLASGDRVDGGLTDVLSLLLEHDVSIDSVGYAGRPLRALAVTDDDMGVVAWMADEKVKLAEIRPTSLVPSLVALLPPGEPGTSKAMAVQASALAAAVEYDSAEDDDPFAGDDDERTALTRAGVSAEDAGNLLDLARNRVAGGQFGVSVGGHRITPLITWFDTHQGRYLMVTEDSWLSFAPTDNERIERRLADVLAGATEEIRAGR
jgi:ESX secretion-associated protein EspG